MSSIAPKPVCHSGLYHFFNPISCKNLSTCKRITIVACHVLMLGIPLLIYSIIKCCRSRIKAPESLQKGFRKITTIENNDNVYAQALRFTETMLTQKEIDTPIKPFSMAVKGQTVAFPDNKIGKLATALHELFEKEKAHKFQNIAFYNSYLYYSYTLSVWALEALDQYQKDHSSLTKEEIFQDQKLYFGMALRFMSEMYHHLRGQAGWDNEKCCFIYPEKMSRERAKEFFKKDSRHYRLRELYNDLCAKVSNQIKLSELDAEFQKAFKPDNSSSEFTV